jgi:GNAT superfamily N-acetyltransferase
VKVVPMDHSHRGWAGELMSEHFGSERVATRGRMFDTSALPGLVAIVDGMPNGFLVYALDGPECEIVALVSVIRRRGIARSLVQAVSALVSASNATRLVLVTTNDNTGAQAFYSAMGFRHGVTFVGAVSEARAFKPEIPLLGEGGVPIEDEFEYVLELTGAS